MSVLDYIPFGKQNAISRERLSELSGMGDRQMRREIERLREEGNVILSSSHSGGYWRSDDASEIGRYIVENKSRIRMLYKTNRKLTEQYYELTGQRFTTVREHTRRIGNQEGK